LEDVEDKREEKQRMQRIEENHFQPPLFVSPDVNAIQDV
jgi:hypothetical protein